MLPCEISIDVPDYQSIEEQTKTYPVRSFQGAECYLLKTDPRTKIVRLAQRLLRVTTQDLVQMDPIVDGVLQRAGR
jgi:hypothetical protein